MQHIGKPNRRWAIAASRLISCLIACAGLVLTSLPVAAETAPLQVNGLVCRGGLRAPTLNVTSPSDGTVVTDDTLPIVTTTSWGNSLTITRGGDTLATRSLAYAANYSTTTPVTLTPGLNTLTLTVSGGCPETTVTATLDVTYDPTVADVVPKTTSNRSPSLRGHVSSAFVRVFVVVNGRTYEAINNGDGTWTLPAGVITPDLADNSYDVRVYTVDPDTGEILSDNTYPGALVIDNQQPSGSLITTSVDTRSPRLDGTVNDPLAHVQVTINGRTYDVINNGDGTWTLPAGAISPGLADGSYDVTLTITDRAGNVFTAHYMLTVKAPGQIGFILPPNTGYLRVGSVNIPSWLIYIALLVAIIVASFMRRQQKNRRITRAVF